MMKKALTLAAMALAVNLLAACGEKPQSAATGKLDQTPYAGTGVATFSTQGWKAGDKTSWEQALKARGQYGQNEYSRSGAAAK
jgi:ABC-type glycerol-3-phosphate transport system substrate-binding protein